MRDDEMRQVLRRELAKWREFTYAALSARIGEIAHSEVLGAEGREYQVEIEPIWDSTPGGDIRVLATIGDGGWRSIKPLCDDFLIRQDGTFVEDDP